MSSVPDQNAWDIDALNINWSGLTAYAYPPNGFTSQGDPKNQAIALSDFLDHPSSQHIHKFLPRRPYLVRQQQQCVSGTSSRGTISPRPFPSDQLSSERKGGHICYNKVFRGLIPGSRYMFTSSECWVRSLSLLMCICILLKDLLRLSFNLILGWLRFMRFSDLGVVFTVAKP